MSAAYSAVLLTLLVINRGLPPRRARITVKTISLSVCIYARARAIDRSQASLCEMHRGVCPDRATCKHLLRVVQCDKSMEVGGTNCHKQRQF